MSSATGSADSEVKVDDRFIRTSLESLATRFELTAEKHAGLRHVMLVGPSRYLGMGGEMAKAKGFNAYRFLGDALARKGQQVYRVLSHNMEPYCCNGQWLFARSIVYSSVSEGQDDGWSYFQNLARQSYHHVCQIPSEIISSWRRIANAADNNEAHTWLIGIVHWAAERSILTVPVDQGGATIAGGPVYMADPLTGEPKPLLIRRQGSNKAGPLVRPASFQAGLRMLQVPPEDAELCSQLKEMLAKSETFTLECDVFSASAEAIRWVLANAPERSSDGNDNTDDTSPLHPIPITWLRCQVPTKKVKGDASKLANWLRRRGAKVVKTAGKNYAERDELLRYFRSGSHVHNLITEYTDDSK